MGVLSIFWHKTLANLRLLCWLTFTSNTKRSDRNCMKMSNNIKCKLKLWEKELLLNWRKIFPPFSNKEGFLNKSKFNPMFLYQAKILFRPVLKKIKNLCLKKFSLKNYKERRDN